MPATVTPWDEGSGTVQVNAPADGSVDRTWWPSWQVSVDGAPVKPERTWGNQLVAVSAGARTIAQRFVPWDAGLGALISISSLLLIGVWSRRRRLHGQPALDTRMA